MFFLPSRKLGDVSVTKHLVWVLIGVAVAALLYTALDGPKYEDPFKAPKNHEQDFSSSVLRQK